MSEPATTPVQETPTPAASATPTPTPAATPATPAATPATPAASTPGAQTPATPATPEKPAATETPAANAYQFEIKDLPTGMEVDKGLVDNFTKFATDKKLDPAVAKELVGLYQQNAVVQFKAMQDAAEKQSNTWYEECLADKDIGGTSFEANKATALKALGAFGSKELTETISQYGLQNNPHFVKFFVKIGRSISEDGATPRLSTTAPVDNRHIDEKHADILFGTKDK